MISAAFHSANWSKENALPPSQNTLHTRYVTPGCKPNIVVAIVVAVFYVIVVAIVVANDRANMYQQGMFTGIRIEHLGTAIIRTAVLLHKEILVTCRAMMESRCWSGFGTYTHRRFMKSFPDVPRES